MGEQIRCLQPVSTSHITNISRLVWEASIVYHTFQLYYTTPVVGDSLDMQWPNQIELGIQGCGRYLV